MYYVCNVYVFSYFIFAFFQVDLNDDWFTKLLEALKKYDKEMSDVSSSCYNSKFKIQFLLKNINYITILLNGKYELLENRRYI